MRAKKFINQPADLVAELLDGYARAFPSKIKLTGNRLVTRATPKDRSRVGLVSLGGSGHEPGLSGFVGWGLLDVSVPGEIFAAPGPARCVEALALADYGAGVLLVVLNHAGDVLSADIAVETARQRGLNVAQVLTHEDISSATRDNPQDRRGLVGFLPVYKIAGAAAEAGLSLEAVHAVAQRMADNMSTLSVAVRSATNPVNGLELSPLGDDEMEIGAGQHGEASSGRMKLASADVTTTLMMERLLADLQVEQGEQLLVIVNGMGATTLMELFIVFRCVSSLLEQRNIKLARCTVGEFITAQEQAGFQLCIARMDDELIRLWDAPCDAPYFVVR